MTPNQQIIQATTDTSTQNICPLCNQDNTDDIGWPLEVDGEIKDGGCQMCWEKQTSESWWQQMGELHKAGLL